jgi:hypothetical protein
MAIVVTIMTSNRSICMTTAVENIIFEVFMTVFGTSSGSSVCHTFANTYYPDIVHLLGRNF